jgi:hypothetical protein
VFRSQPHGLGVRWQSKHREGCDHKDQDYGTSGHRQEPGPCNMCRDWPPHSGHDAVMTCGADEGRGAPLFRLRLAAARF